MHATARTRRSEDIGGGQFSSSTLWVPGHQARQHVLPPTGSFHHPKLRVVDGSKVGRATPRSHSRFVSFQGGSVQFSERNIN